MNETDSSRQSTPEDCCSQCWPPSAVCQITPQSPTAQPSRASTNVTSRRQASGRATTAIGLPGGLSSGPSLRTSRSAKTQAGLVDANVITTNASNQQDRP